MISAYIRYGDGKSISDLSALQSSTLAHTLALIGVDCNGHNNQWGHTKTTKNAAGSQVNDFLLQGRLLVANWWPCHRHLIKRWTSKHGSTSQPSTKAAIQRTRPLSEVILVPTSRTSLRSIIHRRYIIRLSTRWHQTTNGRDLCVVMPRSTRCLRWTRGLS